MRVPNIMTAQHCGHGCEQRREWDNDSNNGTQGQGHTLVERSCIRSVYPWVLQSDETRAVEYDVRELAALEERLVKPHVEKSVQPRVD